MQPRNSSQLSYFQRYTLLQCSSFHYSMKCQYFVAFVHITMCSRTILFNFLCAKRKNRPRGIQKCNQENSSQLSYFQRYTLLQCSSFHYSMKCQYFVAFVHITMCSRIILSNFLYVKGRADREESKSEIRNSSQLSYFQRYTLLQCSSFHYSMKCQYFVAFVHKTMCSRIILSNFLYVKGRADREEPKSATKKFILAIVFPEIHSVIVLFISLFDEMSIFCCFCTYNYVFPNNFI